MIEAAPNEFITDYTPLAAHLVTEGYKLLDVLFEGKFANFVFNKDDATMEVAKSQFHLQKATSSNAAQLIDNYRYLTKRAMKGF
jgi:hypothetical protein